MPLFDLPLSELESYAPEIPIPTDLVPFWTDTLAEARNRGYALARPGRRRILRTPRA